MERIPDQACLSTLSAGPLLVCDTRPIHSMDRATQTPRACRSAHDHSFQGLNDMDRLFAKPSRAEQSRDADASALGSMMRRDESLMAGWSVLHHRPRVAWCTPLVVAEIADLCQTLPSC